VGASPPWAVPRTDSTAQACTFRVVLGEEEALAAFAEAPCTRADSTAGWAGRAPSSPCGRCTASVRPWEAAAPGTVGNHPPFCTGSAPCTSYSEPVASAPDTEPPRETPWTAETSPPGTSVLAELALEVPFL